MNEFFANKTILIPFDFSDTSRAAIDEAISLAHPSTRLSVLNVLVSLNAIAVEPSFVVDIVGDTERCKRVVENMKQQINVEGREIDFNAKVGDPGWRSLTTQPRLAPI